MLFYPQPLQGTGQSDRQFLIFPVLKGNITQLISIINIYLSKNNKLRNEKENLRKNGCIFI